jgi:drug/metabolite transporter (DMT)-like permease
VQYSSSICFIERRIVLKKIKWIIGLISVLAVVTIPKVAIAVAKDVSKLEEVIKETTKLGMSLVIGLMCFAISIACIALLSKRKRNLDKQYYLDYLILMMGMLVLFFLVFLFGYIPIKTNFAIVTIIMYFVITFSLIVIAIADTYKVIKKTLE